MEHENLRRFGPAKLILDAHQSFIVRGWLEVSDSMSHEDEPVSGARIQTTWSRGEVELILPYQLLAGVLVLLRLGIIKRRGYSVAKCE